MPTIDYSGSTTGDINAVSMPTVYINTVLIDGVPHMVDKNGNLYSSEDVNNPILDSDETAYTLEEARSSGADVSDVFSDVSWRTPFGATMQYPHGGEKFISTLKEMAPDVNTIRIDFNAATLSNEGAMRQFKSLADAAVKNDMKLIIQYSDGAMAGRQTPDEEIYPSRIPDPSGRMEEIGHEWAEVMEWFELPENEEILNSVYGWEIVNEPMAYSNDEAGGRAYSDDVVSIINDYGIDWHDKKILVGGLRASAQFEHVDKDLLKSVIGEDLIWSMHLYPEWANTTDATFNKDMFLAEIQKRISSIAGDDILLTEFHLGNGDQDGDGNDNLFDTDVTGGSAAPFNAARVYEFFTENGIGLTYWPPIARSSSFMTNVGGGKFGVLLPQLAMANELWSRDENPAEHAGGRRLSQRPSHPPSAFLLPRRSGMAGTIRLLANMTPKALFMGVTGMIMSSLAPREIICLVSTVMTR